MKPSVSVWVAGLFPIAFGQAQAQTQKTSFDAAWDRVKSGSYQLVSDLLLIRIARPMTRAPNAPSRGNLANN